MKLRRICKPAFRPQKQAINPPQAAVRNSALIRRNTLWNAQARWAPYLFILPFVVLFCVFLLYPLGRSIVMSFSQWTSVHRHRFVGFNNYRFLLSDRIFLLALVNTVGYTIGFLLIQIPAALGLALLLNHPRVRARSVFRFMFFSTNLVGSVFVGALFSELLAPDSGLINRTLALIHPGFRSLNWLNTPSLAMPAVLLASLWLSIGVGMIYFLAALQAVDRELYEVAQIDGAGPWARFRHVTLPGIRPIIIFMILVGTIAGFQLFEIPLFLLSGPGPGYRGLTIVMYLYMNGFEAGDLGYASAIGWALVFMLVFMMLGVSLLQLRSSRTPKET